MRLPLLAATLLLTAAPLHAATYGPPAPAEPAPVEPAFVWPQAMEVASDETLAQAQDRITRVRADATRWEIAYQVLNALDTAQTIDCLQRRVCTELNPLFGKRPSPAKLIAMKGATGLVHWLLFTRLRRDDPHAARTMARISVVLQGGVVAANARFTF